MFSRLLLSVLLTLALLPAAAAENTESVFAAVKDRIVQVRLIDQAGNAKNALGSGFVIAGGGRIISNYHVVSGLVNHPGRFRAEYLAQNGDIGKLALLDIDVVHDLALLRADGFAPAPFALRTQTPAMGVRLYSLGNPLDLGLTIVEGTYNGLLKKSLYERIHFTGSTGTFQHLWREVGTNIDRYHTYPRLVGETGGKDFVVAHTSARPDVLRTAMTPGEARSNIMSSGSGPGVSRSVKHIERPRRGHGY